MTSYGNTNLHCEYNDPIYLVEYYDIEDTWFITEEGTMVYTISQNGVVLESGTDYISGSDYVSITQDGENVEIESSGEIRTGKIEHEYFTLQGSMLEGIPMSDNNYIKVEVECNEDLEHFSGLSNGYVNKTIYGIHYDINYTGAIYGVRPFPLGIQPETSTIINNNDIGMFYNGNYIRIMPVINLNDFRNSNSDK